MIRSRRPTQTPPLPDRDAVLALIEERFGLGCDQLVDRALERLSATKDGVKAVLVIGSYAEGFSNPYSDIDILVVFSQGDSPFIPRSELAIGVGPNGNMIEVVPVTAAATERLISDFNFHGKADAWERFLLHRVYTACCLYDTGWFSVWSNCLAANRLSDILCQDEIVHGMKRIEDIAGLLKAGHYPQAAYKARGLIANAVDGLLYRMGVTNPKRGARSLDYLRATLGFDSPVATRYLSLEFGFNVAETGFREYVARCLTFFQMLNDVVVANSLRSVNVPSLLSCNGFTQERELMFSRDPFVNVASGNARFAIRERNRFYEITEDDARFWIIFGHASSIDDVSTIAAKIFPDMRDRSDIRAAALRSTRTFRRMNILVDNL